MSTTDLETFDLRVWLDDAPVLSGLSLGLRAGAWTAIVGPNGAGKTTLLHALAHLLPAHARQRGEVWLGGQPLAGLGRRARARGLAWLGQNESPGPDLCAHDVVMLGRLPHQGWLAGADDADAAAVERSMRRTQCWDWRDRSLGSLSGGERQRVLLARALAVEAPVLLMDEPLANLDAPHQADWLDLVRDLVREGRSVVTVLHELGMALQADELVVLQAGRVTHQGAPDDPATHRALIDVFDRRIAISRVTARPGHWAVVPLARDAHD
jgi:iron complex transport system ATP-binding protein